MALHGDHRLEERARAAGKADAPAGHGVGLGNPGDGEGPVAQAGHDGGHGGVGAVEDQVFVHVVAHDPDVRVALEDGAEGAEVIGVHGRAGGVVGGVQHHPFGAGGDGGFEILGAKLEAVVLRAGDDDGFAADDLRHQRVGAPVGRGDDDFVAGVDGGHEGVEDDLLAAVGDHDLVERVVEAGVAFELGLDRLLQGGDAVLGGVFGVTAQGGGVGGLDGVGGAGEVGLADGQRDHVDALGAHGAGLDGHLDGAGHGSAGQAGSELGHYVRSLAFGHVRRAGRHERACGPWVASPRGSQ